MVPQLRVRFGVPWKISRGHSGSVDVVKDLLDVLEHGWEPASEVSPFAGVRGHVEEAWRQEGLARGAGAVAVAVRPALDLGQLAQTPDLVRRQMHAHGGGGLARRAADDARHVVRPKDGVVAPGGPVPGVPRPVVGGSCDDLPLVDGDGGHAVHVVDVVEHRRPVGVEVKGQGVPQVHAVHGGQRARIPARGAVQGGQPVGDVHQLAGHPGRARQQRRPQQRRAAHAALPQGVLDAAQRPVGRRVQVEALGGAAVVRAEDDDGVAQHVFLAQRLHHATHRLVHAVHHRGVAPAVVVRDDVVLGDVLVVRGQRVVGVPRVRRHVRQVQEERRGRVVRPDDALRLLGERVRRVAAVQVPGGPHVPPHVQAPVRLLHGGVVEVVVVAGPGSQVGAEPPVRGRVLAPVVAEVPLAHDAAVVAARVQVLRQEHLGQRQPARLRPEQHRVLHARVDGVLPRHERRSGRRADGRHVVVVEDEAGVGQRVQVGRRYLIGSVKADVVPPEVVR